MPWLETAPMEQRERFIRDERLALYTMTELCARYGISRKTGYKWLGAVRRRRPRRRSAIGAARRISVPHRDRRRPSAQLICDGAPPASDLGPREAAALARAAASGHRRGRPSAPPAICWPARGW